MLPRCAQVSDPQHVPEHGVTVVFVELPNTKIELLCPLGAKSPIQKFLDRNPAGDTWEPWSWSVVMQEIKLAISRHQKACNQPAAFNGSAVGWACTACAQCAELSCSAGAVRKAVNWTCASLTTCAVLSMAAGGIHHVCLEVADVTRSMAALTPNGVRVLDPQPKIGAHGNPVGGLCLSACNTWSCT
jgi:catechol 2,3-dioxygenase-like lactoylglutathione lyase family enzyme